MEKILKDMVQEIRAELQTPQWWVRLGVMFGFLVGAIALGLPRLYAAAASVLIITGLSYVGPLKSPRRK